MMIVMRCVIKLKLLDVSRMGWNFILVSKHRKSKFAFSKTKIEIDADGQKVGIILGVESFPRLPRRHHATVLNFSNYRRVNKGKSYGNGIGRFLFDDGIQRRTSSEYFLSTGSKIFFVKVIV